MGQDGGVISALAFKQNSYRDRRISLIVLKLSARFSSTICNTHLLLQLEPPTSGPNCILHWLFWNCCMQCWLPLTSRAAQIYIVYIKSSRRIFGESGSKLHKYLHFRYLGNALDGLREKRGQGLAQTESLYVLKANNWLHISSPFLQSRHLSL